MEECPDPFLLTNSRIISGEGKALVCCVGMSTLFARSAIPSKAVKATPFEKKLESLQGKFINSLKISALLILIGFIASTFLNTSESQSQSKINIEQKVLIASILALAHFIFANPKGILALSKRFSLKTLGKRDLFKIKNLSAAHELPFCNYFIVDDEFFGNQLPLSDNILK